MAFNLLPIINLRFFRCLRFFRFFTHSSRFFKILQDSSRFFKILQDSSRFFKILQDSSRFCQILPDSARFFRFRLRFGAQDSVATSDRGRPRRVQPIGMQGNPETLPEVEEMPAGDGTLDLMDAAVALDSTLRDSRRH